MAQVDDATGQRSSMLAALRATLGAAGGAPEADADSGTDHLQEDPYFEGGLAALAEPPATPSFASAAEPPAELPADPGAGVGVVGAAAAVSGGSFDDVMGKLDRGLNARQKLIDALKGCSGQVL
ncbi:unnamed protein product [Prorocentrum cordatum]|uniref:Uncharacterized protein n=1 Tax=Prorocentrum cordatum TaxID=2364126 RepID=A0ABN9RBX3_9DINO|nr:unnamed protein product [Polarella glacialis]